MKKIIGLLSLLLMLFVLLPACKQKHHHDKNCTCTRECCTEKCCGGNDCDDCKAHSEAGDTTATIGGSEGEATSATDPFSTAKYICPMKCEGGYSDMPGKCKSCGMDLKERK